MKIPQVFRLFFFIIVPAWILAWLIMRIINPQPTFATTQQEMQFWRDRGDAYHYTRCALKEVQKNPANFTAHAVFMRAYVELDAQRTSRLLAPEVDSILGGIPAFYRKASRANNVDSADIGLYGMLLYTLKKQPNANPDSLLLTFDSIVDKERPYVNELLAQIYDLKKEFHKSEYYRKRELMVNPTNAAMYTHVLVSLYTDSYVYEAQRLIQRADSAGVPIDYSVRRLVASGISTYAYLTGVYAPTFSTRYRIEFVMALIVFLVWLMLIKLMDVFDELSNTTFTVLMVLAMLIMPLTTILYDIVYVKFEILFLESFLESVLVTGFIEEFIKILPVLILLVFFPRMFNTPFRLVTAGAVCALVFAFEENILYFGRYYDVTITSKRAVLSTAMHLITTTLIAYGMTLVKFHGKKWYVMPLCFALAMLIHGTYNFLLGEHMRLLAVAIVVMGIYAWGSFINNALNNSPYYEPGQEHELRNKSLFIISGLSFVIVIEFIATGFMYGFQSGETVYKDALFNSVWLIGILGLSFTRLELEQGRWRFIDFAGVGHLALFSGVRNKKIVGLNHTQNALLNAGESFEATVIKRVRSASGQTWYFAETNHPAIPRVIMKFKEEGETFYDFNVFVAMHKTEYEVQPGFDPSEHPFVGFIRVSPASV